MRTRLTAALLVLLVAGCGGAEGAQSTTTAAPTTTTTTITTSEPVATTTEPVTTPAYTAAIDTVTAEQLSASYRAGCPVGPEQLRLVTLAHWGFDGGVHTGILVVHADHAADIVEVFRRLYEIRFPIERMEPVEAYGGSDDASMAANNTSAFNCRPVTGGTSFSQHSYGWAIDVNPIQNPYVVGSTVLPPAGAAYTDRSTPAPGMILAADAVVEAFAAIGWSWGGYWSSPKDYQHFSATGG